MNWKSVPFRRALLTLAVLAAAAVGLAPARLLAQDSTSAATLATPDQPAPAASPAEHGGGEANLKIPDLRSVSFHGIDGHTLLLSGLVVSALGLLFGLVIYSRLKRLAVHVAMRDISELIYETCKT